MSFFKKLFGSSKTPTPPATPPVDYKGFQIAPDPQEEGQQFRLAGVISKEIDGQVRTHQLIRADMFSSRDEAIEATIRKARHVIDEQNATIFSG